MAIAGIIKLPWLGTGNLGNPHMGGKPAITGGMRLGANLAGI
jgi:hypothetical protein